MPRLAPWDDGFEIEDVAELVDMYKRSREAALDDEFPQVATLADEKVCLCDDDLDELVAELASKIRSGKRSPEPSEVRS